MLWQLVPTESADLEPIDVKRGALLLGQGQRASPGILSEWSVPKVAARVHANADRVQVTSMSSCIRVWQAEQLTKLTRGQTVLLQIGDTIDFSSVSEADSPASAATYMLVESLLESLPAAPTDPVVSKIKVSSTSLCLSIWLMYPLPCEDTRCMSRCDGQRADCLQHSKLFEKHHLVQHCLRFMLVLCHIYACKHKQDARDDAVSNVIMSSLFDRYGLAV